MINFLHTVNPSPVLISLGPINIYWYGFFIVLGIILAILITLKLASFYNISKDTVIDLCFWLIISGLIGSRLYHILLELPYYLDHPLNIFKVWSGGLAIHGGLIAGIITLWFYTKNKKLINKETTIKKYPPDKGGKEGSNNFNFWLLASICAPAVALAQAISRWGNYFNQELFGRPTNLPWGIPINIANRPLEYINYQYFHPAFLYESLGNLIIFAVLILLHIYIVKKQKDLRDLCYVLCVMCYVILYSLLRFFTEFLRIDPAYILLGLRFPQIISLIFIALSLGLLIYKIRRANINKALN